MATDGYSPPPAVVHRVLCYLAHRAEYREGARASEVAAAARVSEYAARQVLTHLAERGDVRGEGTHATRWFAEDDSASDEARPLTHEEALDRVRALLERVYGPAVRLADGAGDEPVTHEPAGLRAVIAGADGSVGPEPDTLSECRRFLEQYSAEIDDDYPRGV